MKRVFLSTWIVTHAPDGPTPRAFLVAARSEDRARAKVHLATGFPYDDLHAVLVRRDPAPVETLRPDMEAVLGALEHYTPRRLRPCLPCGGHGHVRRPTETGVETVACDACGGTGARPDRPARPAR